MQKTPLAQAAVLAVACLGAGSALAQSSVTLYGTADISVDNVHKTAGVRFVPALSATQGRSSTVSRVSPSGSSQTSIGLKGSEDMGGGYKASFVLEGQLSHDTGGLNQDGRLFGRQSYVGLTTPLGEVRLGRQYAPIFYSAAVITGERLSATDLYTEAGSTNNLQVRQDNQISYWTAVGAFTGAVAYSPNAGAYNTVSPVRGASAGGSLGGILGAASAGSERAANKTGRAMGFFGNYAFDAHLNMTVGWHQNDFDGASLGTINPLAPTTLLLATNQLDRYHAVNLGVRYVLPDSGLALDGAVATGKYSFDGTADTLKLQSLNLGAQLPVANWTFSAQASQVKFTNFTQGKDTGSMLGAEYALSKRTVLYSRWVQIRDDEGKASSTGLPVAVVGGPDVVATAFGLREIPVFAGAGINPGGKATYVGAGIRHIF